MRDAAATTTTRWLYLFVEMRSYQFSNIVEYLISDKKFMYTNV